MTPLVFPATPEEDDDCRQIIKVVACGEGRSESGCDCLRRIEDCRCRLAILRAASKRFLFGWQQRILGDVALNLYRLSRCCLLRCGRSSISARFNLETCAHMPGGPLLIELQGILSDCAKQMEQGAGIDQEVGKMSRIGRALEHYLARLRLGK